MWYPRERDTLGGLMRPYPRGFPPQDPYDPRGAQPPDTYGPPQEPTSPEDDVWRTNHSTVEILDRLQPLGARPPMRDDSTAPMSSLMQPGQSSLRIDRSDLPSAPRSGVPPVMPRDGYGMWDGREPEPEPAPPPPPRPPATTPPPTSTDERDRYINDFVSRGPQGERALDRLNRAYREMLGRPIDSDTLGNWQRHIAQNPGRPMPMSQILQDLYESEEGRGYRARSTAAVPGPGGGTGGTTPPPAGTYPRDLPQRGNTGTLGGFPDALGRSMKHVYGAIASRYPNDRRELQNIVNDPDFKLWFPNARLVGDDKIDFGGQLSDFESGVPVNLVDVFKGGDDMHQWIDQNFVTGGPNGPSGQPPTGGPIPPPTPTPGRPPAVPPHTPINPRANFRGPQTQSEEPYRLLHETVPMSALMQRRG